MHFLVPSLTFLAFGGFTLPIAGGFTLRKSGGTKLLTTLFLCLLPAPMLRIVPGEPHDVRRLKPLLRVRLQRAEAFHPQALPSLAPPPLRHIPPSRIHRTKFRRGATAKVIHTHADAPQRYPHHFIDVFTAYAVGGIFFFASPVPMPR